MVQKIEKAAIILFFSVMTAAMILQVVNRNILHINIGWLEELSRYCMVWIVMLASGSALRKGEHISMEVVTAKVSGKVKMVLEILVQLVILVFVLTLLIASFRLVGIQIRTGQISPGLRVHMALPYLSLPVAFAGMAIGQIIDLAKRIPALSISKGEG
ncbi:TRAP transporter small permease [Marasmitruncus massiliensis]|uniref:TRAP transporter small permease n=1 Tax=Marasmitruncus massiliensis TaxID=1944642 RepID=UPI000C7A5A9F|nr:TRAP transporter small permease [Marasmitruncus massiliensis]